MQTNASCAVNRLAEKRRRQASIEAFDSVSLGHVAHDGHDRRLFPGLCKHLRTGAVLIQAGRSALFVILD